MRHLNIFGDDRKIPKVSINVKVKVKTKSAEEGKAWNRAFGYIMKKPRTKLEFLMTNTIRGLKLDRITLSKIKGYISEEDYNYLSTVESIFDNNLTDDVKVFILSVLKIPVLTLEKLTQE